MRTHTHTLTHTEDAYRIDAEIDGEVVGLDILDTAGQVSTKQEDLSTLTPSLTSLSSLHLTYFPCHPFAHKLLGCKEPS